MIIHFQLAAIHRAEQPEDARQDFFLLRMIPELHNTRICVDAIGSSEISSLAYGLKQYIEQIAPPNLGTFDPMLYFY